MVEPRQSAMQRIQVGLIGLVVVLLFVSLANMVLDRVADSSPGSSASDQAAATEPMPDEPLAELGVTPVASEEDKAKSAAPPPSANVRQVPSNTGR